MGPPSVFFGEEGLDVGEFGGEGDAFGQGVEEDATIGFVHDAAVEDDDDAAVGGGADEAAKTLAEAEDRGCVR